MSHVPHPSHTVAQMLYSMWGLARPPTITSAAMANPVRSRDDRSSDATKSAAQRTVAASHIWKTAALAG